VLPYTNAPHTARNLGVPERAYRRTVRRMQTNTAAPSTTHLVHDHGVTALDAIRGAIIANQGRRVAYIASCASRAFGSDIHPQSVVFVARTEHMSL
jgi:hypothetical protein